MFYSTAGKLRRSFLSCSILIFSFYRGVMMPPVEMLTKDGYDLQFGTNVLGTYIHSQ